MEVRAPSPVEPVFVEARAPSPGFRDFMAHAEARNRGGQPLCFGLTRRSRSQSSRHTPKRIFCGGPGALARRMPDGRGRPSLQENNAFSFVGATASHGASVCRNRRNGWAPLQCGRRHTECACYFVASVADGHRWRTAFFAVSLAAAAKFAALIAWRGPMLSARFLFSSKLLCDCMPNPTAPSKMTGQRAATPPARDGRQIDVRNRRVEEAYFLPFVGDAGALLLGVAQTSAAASSRLLIVPET